ncbi:MAG: fatty acid--CoA ligase family protein, partial [Defluviicoccus sp.]|nr:fatty acid--CoA ligase family protein [Defluviicoccus sp.]
LTDYRRFLANARLNCSEKQMGPGSIMLSAAPFTHLFGLYSFHLTLYGGGATALLPAFSPPGLVQAVREFRPSHIFAAPAHIASCTEAGLLDSEALAPVHYCVVSGAKAAPAFYRKAQEAFGNGRVAQLWGMTECQCGMFTRPYEDIERAAWGCGRPSPGNEARVCDANGKPLPAGEEGELQIRGASVFGGYDRNDEANAASFTGDGWFRTGDRAVIDETGAVSITGREKDLINRGGVKINPADVEEAIDRHPDIVQSAIVPMPDPVLGERSCCFAIPRDGAAPQLADLVVWLDSEGIAKLKWPERLILVDEMPLTPTRKVIKGRLRIPD